MNKILIFLTLFLGLIACQNQDIDFPDFDYTTGYFPYQYPVRTLVLGDYIYDNTNDNNHKFLISTAMGGVYSNTEDRVFNIEVANDLCNTVLFGSTLDTIRILPPDYYTLSSTSTITIPAGKVSGGIEVQLKDAFFDDPRAIKLSYVIPLRILSATKIDTILQGETTKVNPDPRIDDLWDTPPKNFTMFAVNFINAYHGKYFHRGTSIVKNTSGTVIETNEYRTPYIVTNEIWSLVTTGKTQVTVSDFTHSTLVPGVIVMKLTFSDDNSCVITEGEGSFYTITGTGKFVKDADEWGDLKRDAIHISYQLKSEADKTYIATDTLVIRDRAVTMQLFDPVVYTK